jgi:glycosyltransferase involved in cell wall biosynthesis
MIRKIPNEPIDFIYCPYELFEWICASVLVKNKLKIPLVVSINLFEPHEISTFPLFILRYKTYFRNLFLKKSDLIFCASNEIKNWLIRLGIDSSRLISIGSGISIDDIKSVGSQKKVYDACFMGDLIPRKGIIDLIYVWKNVTKEIPEAKLLVIGKAWSEEYEQKIKYLVKRYALQNNISFTGFLAGKEKYKLMKQSKIFIFPSYLESFGQVVCEALACELPIVAYNLPALREHYGDLIMYVQKGDIKGMSRTVVDLLRNYDSQLTTVMKLGMEKAEEYSWENIASRMLEIIVQKLFS